MLGAREMRLAGATVPRGPMGFERPSRSHRTKIPRPSEDLPRVIEIVGDRERVTRFPEAVEPMTGSALATLGGVQVPRCGEDGSAPR